MYDKFEKFEITLDKLKQSIDGDFGSQKLFLSDALGRVLAEDIIAKEDNPKDETSSMDGYAIRFEDQELGELTIIDKLPAGSYSGLEVKRGECIKTFTGSLMSRGSDTLIPIENVEVIDNKIKIISPVSKGFAVRPVGENYKKDEILIKKGTKLGYAQIGLLAELGYVQVSVYIKPRVAILATGSEILDFGEPKTSPAQIRSSNHITIESILKDFGAETIRFELIGDDKDAIEKKVKEALLQADILITTGGVSVGDFDFVKEVVGDLKPEYLVDGAFIKPGRHIKIVKLGNRYIFALPGFPYSSSVGTFLYILPFLKAKMGGEFSLPITKAYIEEDYNKRSKYKEFTACNLLQKDGKVVVNLDGKKVGSSAILNNMLDNASLLIIDEKTKLIQKGEMVEVIELPKFYM